MSILRSQITRVRGTVDDGEEGREGCRLRTLETSRPSLRRQGSSPCPCRVGTPVRTGTGSEVGPSRGTRPPLGLWDSVVTTGLPRFRKSPTLFVRGHRGSTGGSWSTRMSREGYGRSQCGGSPGRPRVCVCAYVYATCTVRLCKYNTIQLMCSEVLEGHDTINAVGGLYD